MLIFAAGAVCLLLKEGVVCIFQHVILERKGGEVVDAELDGGNYVWMNESTLRPVITLSVHYFQGFLVSIADYPSLEPLSIYPYFSRP